MIPPAIKYSNYFRNPGKLDDSKSLNRRVLGPHKTMQNSSCTFVLFCVKLCPTVVREIMQVP